VRITFFYLLYIGTHVPCMFGERSVWRPLDQCMPEITTEWIDSAKERVYHLRHAWFEESALFKQYEEAYFEEHLFPDGPVAVRNHPDCKVMGAELKSLIEDLVVTLQSIKRRKQEFEHFIVLKQRDYNPKTHSGLIVLKFKKYPFVVKLFMETPKSFVKPFSKGFEPSIFFMMGGGINRYLSGFSRVKNAEAIRLNIDLSPEWAGKIDIPRKWFWRPRQARFFRLTGKNIGESSERVAVLPSVYALICDAIEADRSLRLLNKANRRLAMRLSRFLGVRVDPHIDNFMIETGTGLIVLVDTEHFPTMVGLREPLEFNNYGQWYTRLSCKCFQDMFCRSKKERKAIQNTATPGILLCG